MTTASLLKASSSSLCLHTLAKKQGQTISFLSGAVCLICWDHLPSPEPSGVVCLHLVYLLSSEETLHEGKRLMVLDVGPALSHVCAL